MRRSDTHHAALNVFNTPSRRQQHLTAGRSICTSSSSLTTNSNNFTTILCPAESSCIKHEFGQMQVFVHQSLFHLPELEQPPHH